MKEARKAVEKWFSDVPAGKPVEKVNPPAATLTEEKRVVMEDKVQLPRIMMVWLTPPAFQPGNAEMDLVSNLLTGGKNSRLYKKLVYELQIAQNVFAYSDPKKFASEFYLVATARPGVTLSQLEKVIQEEIDKLKIENPEERELQRVKNQYESEFISQIESAGGFSGKANQLNQYYYYTGNPDYFNEDLQRYKAVGVSDISAAVRLYLKDNARVVMSIVPEGKTDLAATKN
jgi:zinc protease